MKYRARMKQSTPSSTGPVYDPIRFTSVVLEAKNDDEAIKKAKEWSHDHESLMLERIEREEITTPIRF